MKKILLFLLLVCAGKAHGAIAFVQAPASCTTASAGTTLTCTYSGATVAGHTLIAVASPRGYPASVYTVAVSDSVNGSWTQGVQCFSAGDNQSDLFYFPSSGAGTITVTVTLGTSDASGMSLSIAEYSGVNTSSPFDVAATCSTASYTSTVTAPTVTTTLASDMIFNGSSYEANPGTITASSPYTIRVNSYNAMADYAPGSTGAQAGSTFTTTFAGDAFRAIGAALKAAGGASSAATQAGAFLVGP